MQFSIRFVTLLAISCQQVASFSFQSQQFTSSKLIHSKQTAVKVTFINAPQCDREPSSSTALKAILPSSLMAPSLNVASSMPAFSSSSITSPLGSVTVLALVILIHELGHFLAARSFNINVQEFSVGVGPKVFGFTRNTITGEIFFGNDKKVTDENIALDSMENNSDTIEFNLRAIPLGGYVRFPENYNTTEEYQLEVQADEKRREINRIIKERVVASTGESSGLMASVSNTLQLYKSQEKRKEERLLALQIMAEDLEKDSKKAPSSSWWNSVFKGTSTRNKKTQSEKKKSIVIEEDGTVSTPPIEYYDDPNLLQNRNWQQRAVVLAGGVVFNILLAFSLYFGELTIGTGMSRPSFGQGAIISSMPRVDGPSAGLLNKGDVIIALNGEHAEFV